jgi:hypothetical protein
MAQNLPQFGLDLGAEKRHGNRADNRRHGGSEEESRDAPSHAAALSAQLGYR